MHRLLTVRLAAWRARHALRILLAAVLVGVGVRVAAPPAPPTVAVTVSARPIPAGRTLTAADVRLVRWPGPAVPPEAARAVDEAIGRRTTIAVPEGLALVPSLFTTGRFAAEPPTGAVVVPVRLGGAAALRIGDAVEVVADLGCSGGTEPVAVAALVVGLGASAQVGAADSGAGDSGGLGAGWGLDTAASRADADETVLVALTPENGRKIAGFVEICHLSAIIVP